MLRSSVDTPQSELNPYRTSLGGLASIVSELTELKPSVNETNGDVGSDLDDDEDQDLQGASGMGRSSRPRPATRRRVVQSCSECRRRKIKCDKK